MDWLLGCFKCGQRRRAGCSIDSPESRKDRRETFGAAGFLSANSAEKAGILHDGNSNFQAESFEMGKILTMPGNALARTCSGSSKIEKRHRSRSGHSCEQLSLVEKLEEEINIINKKLVDEASQARILTNEVRHLRQCSELLDSTDAFKRALDVLGNASDKGDVEESRPLFYLQSMLSKIETADGTLEAFSGERTDERTSKGSKEESVSLSSCIVKDKSRTERETLVPDQAQRNSSSEAIEEGTKLEEEHTASISVCQPSFEVVNVDANKAPSPSALKRRSSTTFSFSGFVVFEDEPEAGTISEHRCSSTEISVSKIIETHDTSTENLVEASKSLFAFATSSSQSHSISMEHSLIDIGSEDFSFLSSDSEVESCLKRADVEAGLFKLHESPRSLQDENTRRSHGMCPNFVVEQQAETLENRCEGFSDVSSHIFTSTSSRTGSRSSSNQEASTSYGCEVLQMLVASIEDKESVNRHANSRASASQLQDRNDAVLRNLCFTDDNIGAPASNSEVKHGFKPLSFNGGLRMKSLERDTHGEATLLEQETVRIFSTAASEHDELLEKNKHCNRVTHCIDSLSSLSHGEFSTLVGDSSVELSTGGAPSISSSSTGTSPQSIHKLSASPQVGQNKNRCSAESPSTPMSVNSHASVVLLSTDDPSKAHYTPLRTPLASLSHGETPNSLNSRGSPTNLGEDRPILGTVAAHWNHSSSSTKQWWDGKGIPNSTNKYKEDQKVSWHATPFEVRLERALAKQGRMFQKWVKKAIYRSNDY